MIATNVPETHSFESADGSADDYDRALLAIRALEHNANFDREEIDVLRWVTGSVSAVLEKPLQSLSSEARAVVGGVEIGEVLRGPPARFHRSCALHGVRSIKCLPLDRLLTALGEDRRRIAKPFMEKSLLRDAPLVFPLLSAVCSGVATGSGAHVPRPLVEWGARALLEVVVLRIPL